MKQVLNVFTSNRFKSFYWRTSMMVLSLAATFLTENLSDFQFPGYVTVALGLALGELSKYLNTR